MISVADEVGRIVKENTFVAAERLKDIDAVVQRAKDLEQKVGGIHEVQLAMSGVVSMVGKYNSGRC